MRCGLLAILATAVLVTMYSVAASQPTTFTGLGVLPGGVIGGDVDVFDMSQDGSMVVGISSYAVGREAFVWTVDSGMVGLGDLPGGDFNSGAYGISADGAVIVGQSQSAFGSEAFRWTQSTGMVGLSDFDGGNFFSLAYAVSDDGTVVVGEGGTAGTTQAVRWTEADGMVKLSGPFTFSSARGISADGSVIVGTGQTDQPNEGFVWNDADGMVGLGDLPGGNIKSHAFSVSADGKVIAGQSASELGDEAMIWSADTDMIGLGDLPGGTYDSNAHDISADGLVVGGAGVTASLTAGAFVWDAEHGMRNLKGLLLASGYLEVEGWELDGVRAISGDGMIVAGHGINPDGQREAWISIVPEGPLLDADFDDDGDVDGEDFLLWQTGFGTSQSGHLFGDADWDGDTDGEDFLIWQSQFGLGSGSVSAAVPEPESIVLLLLISAVSFPRYLRAKNG